MTSISKTNDHQNYFIQGPISTDLISTVLKKYKVDVATGAHQIFIGQVRADLIDGKKVKAIEYSAQREMSIKIFEQIENHTRTKFNLSSIQIFHSLGIVRIGEICLFASVSSKRRKNVQLAIKFLVEEIKAKTPIFGKEIFSDDSHQWKTNY